jgi:hypothetical protein
VTSKAAEEAAAASLNVVESSPTSQPPTAAPSAATSYASTSALSSAQVHSAPEVASIQSTPAPSVVSIPHPQQSVGFTFAIPKSAPLLAPESLYGDDFQYVDSDSESAQPQPHPQSAVTDIGPDKNLGAVVEEAEEEVEQEETKPPPTTTAVKQPRALSASERFKKLRAAKRDTA